MGAIKLLALDLDGTLLDDRSQISETNRRAVSRAQRAGVQVALCTGRNLADARRFSDALEAPADWAVTANGADVRAMRGGGPVFSRGLTAACCTQILQVCAQFQTDPCLYTNEMMYHGEALKQFFAELRRRGHPANLAEWKARLEITGPDGWRTVAEREQGRLTKAILYHENPKTVDQITETLDRTGLFTLAPSVMYGGLLKNVEVNRCGVHKGAALCALAKELGCGMEQVMALGDSENDVTMLQMAGLGVAMSNASGDVRAAADVVTEENTADGVAQAIYQYLLQRDTP